MDCVDVILNRTVFRTAVVAVLAALATRANATTLSYSDIFSQFNAVITGNFNASSEVEGRTVVGGNVMGGANFEIHTGLATSSFGLLSVYGSVTDTGTLNIDNGGSIAIAGSNAAIFQLEFGRIRLCRRHQQRRS